MHIGLLNNECPLIIYTQSQNTHLEGPSPNVSEKSNHVSKVFSQESQKA